MAPRSTTALFAGLLLAASGCLSNVHRIPSEELHALAHEPPEQRSERVRVIQGFAGDDQPPEAPRAGGGGVFIVGGVHGVGGAAPRRGIRPRRTASSRAHDSKWWLIAAGLLAVGLAASEGARYDGWVRLHPEHPVHLYGPFGEYTWVPLAELDPETAHWATKAFVRETEGPWQPLGRAPLNRVGWTYSFLLGAAEIPSVAERQTTGGSGTAPGFMGHIQVGHFPAQQVGILLDFGMGYRVNDFDQTVFESRNALELQLLPFSAGKFHAGGFGNIGLGLRSEDAARATSERRGLLAGIGALFQLELTTRLALTGRVGVTRIFQATTSEAGIGLSVY